MRAVIASGIVTGVIVGLGFISYNALADEGDDIPRPIIKSYDIGDNAPRVVGWCFGSDAIYQANESDGISVVGNSANCAEGGLLRG